MILNRMKYPILASPAILDNTENLWLDSTGYHHGFISLEEQRHGLDEFSCSSVVHRPSDSGKAVVMVSKNSQQHKKKLNADINIRCLIFKELGNPSRD